MDQTLFIEMLEMLKVLASSTAVLNHLNPETNEDLCNLIKKGEALAVKTHDECKKL